MRFLRLASGNHILREGDGGGEGGAGGGSSNSGGEGGAPESVDEKKVNEMINSALSARFTAFEKKHAKEQAKANEAQATTITNSVAELLDTKLTEALEKGAAGGDGGKGKSGSDDISDHPQVKGMQKTMDALKAKVDAAEAQSKSDRKQKRDSNLRSKLMDTLTSAGLKDANRARHAATILLAGSNVAYEDEDGDDIVFTDPDGAELSLADGVKGWLASDDGKLYIPARGASGSGEPPGGTGGVLPSKGVNPLAGDKDALGNALGRLVTGGGPG